MKKLLSFSILILALAGCNPKKNRNDIAVRIDSLLNRQVNKDQPGMAVLIAKGDEVIFAKGYGVANLSTGEPITTKTLFNLGSISKTFVATAILLLHHEGKLSVEDPIIKYFPNFKNPKVVEHIQIKHLLTHTSGLPDNRNVNADTVFYLTAKDEENWAPELLVDSLQFEPGTAYEYSNPAFNGLALIIEKVSGQKWQDFVRQRIFVPAGMNASTITDGPHPDDSVSHAYVKIAGRWTEDDYGEEPTFAAAGNGGVWSSVEELMRYEAALTSSKILDSATLIDARTSKNNHPVQLLSSLENKTWNLGWSWFVTTTDRGTKLVGHSGTQGGFHCNYMSVPEKKILFVMLSNFPCERQLISDWVITQLEKENWLD